MAGTFKVVRCSSQNGQALEVLPFTDELVARISRLNGYMSPDEVRTVLEKSYKPVYTSFAFYKRERGKEKLEPEEEL